MLNNASIQSVETAPASASSRTNPPAPINVWLVDDNQSLRNTLMEILGGCEGLRCTAAFPSPNAVLSTLASKAGPDVILLDIQMGEANGLDAIRPIKALSRSTQVLMFTTCFDSESKRRAFSAGASDFLLKNFPLERILDSIQQASRNPAPHLKRTAAQKQLVGTSVASNPSRATSTSVPWLKRFLDVFHDRRN